MAERRIKWEDYPDIMTTKDIQEFFNLSKETVLRMIHQEGFPKLRIQGGRKYIYVKSALQEYLHKTSLKKSSLSGGIEIDTYMRTKAERPITCVYCPCASPDMYCQLLPYINGVDISSDLYKATGEGKRPDCPLGNR